jgi:hypothetical protein
MFEIKKKVLISRDVTCIDISHYFRNNRTTFLKDHQISAEWLNYKRNDPQGWYEKPIYGKESTYNNCIVAEYFLKTHTIEVVYFEGAMLDGYPQEKRCKWVLNVPESAVKLLEELEIYFDSKLIFIAGYIHEQQMEQMRKRNIDKILKTLLTPD